MDETRQLVEKDDLGKWDVVVRRRDLVMRGGDFEFPMDLAADAATLYERLSPSPHAFGQVCARLGIPAAYLRQCPAVLRDQNVNYWLAGGNAGNLETAGRADSRRKANGKTREQEERWLFRARYGTLRASLSESYSPLDNGTLLDALRPTIPPRYRVEWLGLDDVSLHLRIVDPDKPRSVLPGDDFFVGIHVANSEVGGRSVSIDALVYRLVCSNGLIALVKGKSLLRRRHIHIAGPRFRASLEESMSHAMAAADDLLERLRTAAQAPVPDPDSAIERLGRSWKLGEDTVEVAKAALQTESSAVQHSAYGLVNAFTHAAQGLRDDQRYDLEVLAGHLAQRGVPRFALASSGQDSEMGDWADAGQSRSGPIAAEVLRMGRFGAGAQSGDGTE